MCLYAWYIEGILPKGPYLPCVSMAGRVLSAGYHRYIKKTAWLEIVLIWWWNSVKMNFQGFMSECHLFMNIYLHCGADKDSLSLMMTSSNGNIIRITVSLCGEFTGHRWIPHTQRPVTRSFDVFLYVRLNKRLSKQSWGWWFETPSCPLWRHCNVLSAAIPYPCLDVLKLYLVADECILFTIFALG